MLFRKMAIIGVGLIGGSLGAALKRCNAVGEIVGIGHRQNSLDEALANGCVDRITLDGAAGVQGADVVVIATPVGLIVDKAVEIADAVSPDCVVTDVGSTKRSLTQRLDKVFSGRARFVGSHPMAGSEKRTAANADADLFKGALCIITPTQHTHPEAQDAVDRMWQSVGGLTCIMPPDEHDRCVALASHLPHLVAAALVQSQDAEALACAASGFADSTRIAASDPCLWRDICLDNASEIIRGIDRFSSILNDLRRCLDGNDAEGLYEILASAAQARKSWSRSGESL